MSFSADSNYSMDIIFMHVILERSFVDVDVRVDSFSNSLTGSAAEISLSQWATPSALNPLDTKPINHSIKRALVQRGVTVKRPLTGAEKRVEASRNPNHGRGSSDESITIPSACDTEGKGGAGQTSL